MAGLDPVKVGLAALVVLLGGTTVFLYTMETGTISPRQAESIVSETLGMGADVSVESVTRATPSLYKVLVDMNPDSAGGISPLYLTTDGKHLITDPLNVTDYRNRFQARNRFISCLADSNVRIYGNLSTTATRYQVQIFGGANGLGQIYGPFGALSNRTQARLVRGGVRVLPFHTLNGSVIGQGVQGIGFFEQATGCRYPYSNTTISLTAP